MVTRTETMVQLNNELINLLDKRAAQTGVSRSQLIRRAIETYLAADRETELDRQIVVGYTRVPQGGAFDEDEWGNLDSFMQAMATETFRQVAREERGAGPDP